MTILVPSWRYGGAPVNASPTWSQACKFWRTTSGVCPAVNRLNIPFNSLYNLALSGGFLGSTIIGCPYTVSGCASNCGTATYFTLDAGAYWQNIIFDVWAALDAGAWSSSTTLNFYCNRRAAGTVINIAARISPESDLPTYAEKTITPGAYIGAVCPTSLVATATWYDDGTISLT
jgi:hypothetical protein